MPDYWYPTAFCVWGEEEHAAMDRVRASGRWTMGPETEAFEHEFAAYHGKKYGIMVNSGSSANLLMIAALCQGTPNRKPLAPGDRAIVPAIAWSTTYAPIIQHGIDPLLADVDHSWNADPFYGENNIDDEAQLVVGCSILGNANQASEWSDAARIIGAYYIEDNCESLGAKDPHGYKTGTRGLMNSFSFFWSHQIGAIEGGMVLTDDEDCNKLCRMLRAHGWSRDIASPQEFDEEYDFRIMGYNLRPDEIRAAVAREQLKKLDRNNVLRRANWDHFRKLCVLGKLPVSIQFMDGEPAPFGLSFMVLVNPHNVEENRRYRLALVHALREAGIDCRLPTGGSFRMHKYGSPWARQKTPNADFIHQTGLFLGNGPLDLTEQIDKAISVMTKVLTWKVLT